MTCLLIWTTIVLLTYKLHPPFLRPQMFPLQENVDSISRILWFNLQSQCSSVLLCCCGKALAKRSWVEEGLFHLIVPSPSSKGAKAEPQGMSLEQKPAEYCFLTWFHRQNDIDKSLTFFQLWSLRITKWPAKQDLPNGAIVALYILRLSTSCLIRLKAFLLRRNLCV